MNMRVNPMDAMQTNLGFVMQQATVIEAGVYRMQFPELDYAQLVPLDFGAPEWVKTVTYFSHDGGRGRAEWINGNAKDIPVVGFQLDRHEIMVHTAGIGYDYGYEEVNYAARLGVSLPGENAQIARRAYEEFTHRVAIEGDATKGFYGILNHPSVPIVNAPADGIGSVSVWTAKTGEQIIRDVNTVLMGTYDATNTLAMADTLLMPYQRWTHIATTRFMDTNETILSWLQKNNALTAQTGRALTIRARRGMNTRGVGNTMRMLAYRRSPDVLKMHIPMPHRFLPVQISVLQYIVPGIFRLGGVDVKLPMEMRYMDGI